VEQLKNAVLEFCHLSSATPASSQTVFYQTIAQMNNLCAAINEASDKGVSKDELFKMIAVPREISSKSPFVKRLQTWPRGYQGDFETIEYLCANTINAPADTLEYYIEWHALNSAIAQQHRNKVALQAEYISNVLIAKKEPKILIIGCGSGRDLRNIQKNIEVSDAQFYLNDIDDSAIEFTKKNLSDGVLKKCTFIHENVLKLVRNPLYNTIKFDLVLFGGVFDYLPTKAIHIILKTMYAKMLTDNSTILFTNINIGNPFKCWMEFIADWTLIERSEADCLQVCTEAGIPHDCVRVFKESTGLTLITEISKKG
jgi:extracellular factor (EF) 3-hydroxypalmitic acid methyl ester biosynthesis protein